MSNLVTQQSTALTKPSHAPIGFDDFDMEDLMIPRLNLLQGNSKAVQEDGTGKMGDFQNSLTEEVLGSEIEAVLLTMQNGAAYLSMDNGLVCRSDDGIKSFRGDHCIECPYGEYYKEWRDNKPPKCVQTKSFFVLLRSKLHNPDCHPFILSFSKTSFKAGRLLATRARLSGDDIFARSWILTGKKEKNPKGMYAVIDIKNGTQLTEEEKSVAFKWFKIMTQNKAKPHSVDESYPMPGPLQGEVVEQI